MQTKHSVEAFSTQPIISLESEFVDYQETQQLCPTREVKSTLTDIPLEGKISRIAAALALIEACENDPVEARTVLDAAIRIKEGSLRELSATEISDGGE
jgi:hypothetical protein